MTCSLDEASVASSYLRGSVWTNARARSIHWPSESSRSIPSGRTTIQPRILVISAVVLVATVIVCEIVLGLWMREFEHKEEQANALYPGRQEIDVDQFPEPRLQKEPPIDLIGVMREERERVTSYGWVDQKAGVARACCHVEPSGWSGRSGWSGWCATRFARIKLAGASTASNATPIANQADRHPHDCTSEPTTGNAIMKPMLMTML